MLTTGQGPFNKHGLTFIQAWISNSIHYEIWDEITYPFPKFNGTATEVWEWVNFIPYFTGCLKCLIVLGIGLKNKIDSLFTLSIN